MATVAQRLAPTRKRGNGTCRAGQAATDVDRCGLAPESERATPVSRSQLTDFFGTHAVQVVV